MIPMCSLPLWGCRSLVKFACMRLRCLEGCITQWYRGQFSRALADISVRSLGYRRDLGNTYSGPAELALVFEALWDYVLFAGPVTIWCTKILRR